MQKIVPQGRAFDCALEFAARLAGHPQPGLLADRAGVMVATEQNLPEGLAVEFERGVPVLGDPAVAERIQRHGGR